MKDHELIFDWNVEGPVKTTIKGPVELNDETLRDGLQSPSVVDPPMDAKIRLLHLMASLG